MNKSEPIPWRGVRTLEKLILIVLPLVAMTIITLPFLDRVILRRLARLPGMRPVVVWLVNDFNAWLVAGGVLLLWGLFILWVRRRLKNDRRLWSSTGCPQCKERDLVRVSRNTSDRFYGLIGVPAYRYACRNCTWRGLRVAHRELSPERIAEMEASLSRFDLAGEPAESIPSSSVTSGGDDASEIPGDVTRPLPSAESESVDPVDAAKAADIAVDAPIDDAENFTQPDLANTH